MSGTLENFNHGSHMSNIQLFFQKKLEKEVRYFEGISSKYFQGQCHEKKDGIFPKNKGGVWDQNFPSFF